MLRIDCYYYYGYLLGSGKVEIRCVSQIRKCHNFCISLNYCQEQFTIACNVVMMRCIFFSNNYSFYVIKSNKIDKSTQFRPLYHCQLVEVIIFVSIPQWYRKEPTYCIAQLLCQYLKITIC